MDQTNYDVGPRVKIIMASRIKNIPDQFFPKQDFNMLSLLYISSYILSISSNPNIFYMAWFYMLLYSCELNER